MSKKHSYSFKVMSEYFYYIALLDMLAGIPFLQLENSLLYYQDKEQYEACDGIQRALKEAEFYTLSELERRVVEFEVENKKLINGAFREFEDSL